MLVPPTLNQTTPFPFSVIEEANVNAHCQWWWIEFKSAERQRKPGWRVLRDALSDTLSDTSRQMVKVKSFKWYWCRRGRRGRRKSGRREKKRRWRRWIRRESVSSFTFVSVFVSVFLTTFCPPAPPPPLFQKKKIAIFLQGVSEKSVFCQNLHYIIV